MEAVPENLRMFRRALWLIRLRWLAIVGVLGAGLVAGGLFGLPIYQQGIYAVAAILALYNAVFLFVLRRMAGAEHQASLGHVRLLIDAQIVLDLLMLTILLHFSGGMENPFVPYYVFHMAIASIVLSVRESYLHATVAAALYTSMVGLEHAGVIRHYCILGADAAGVHPSNLYVIGSIVGMTTTLFLVVYMTSFIAVRLRRQEHAYREANALLARKDRIKDEYVARVTHDIKGHLAAIQSCLDVVANTMLGELNARQSEFIRRAFERTKRLTRFVRDLLRLTRMRLSEGVEKEAFAIEEVLRRAAGSVAPLAAEKSIRIDVHCNPEVSRVEGSASAIEEAVGHLLLNAVTYSPVEGRVEVVAEERNDGVEIRVADAGVGIAAEDIEHVFEEFYRGGSARRLGVEGTGLGLSIVKQIVTQHGGRIWVESKPGVGTTVAFVLPKASRVAPRHRDRERIGLGV